MSLNASSCTLILLCHVYYDKRMSVVGRERESFKIFEDDCVNVFESFGDED